MATECLCNLHADLDSMYVCVSCGTSVAVEDASKWPQIASSSCRSCGETVDIFQSYEPVLITLHVALHRPAAWRHVLFNVTPSSFPMHSHVAICIFMSVIRAYCLWVVSVGAPSLQLVDTSPFFIRNILSFLIWVGVSLVEEFLFIFILSLSLGDLIPFLSSMRSVTKLVSVGSVSRLCVIPMLVWRYPLRMLYIVRFATLAGVVAAVVFAFPKTFATRGTAIVVQCVLLAAFAGSVWRMAILYPEREGSMVELVMSG